MAVRVRQSLQVNFFIMRDFTYSGFENQEACNHLRAGETCKVTGIGNNHGHMNGWVGRNQIYGKVVEIL